MQVRINDMVEVLTGEDRGVRGRVLSVDRKNGKVVVESVNVVIKHMRPTRQAKQGGRLSREMPVAISNVALVCPACGSRARTCARYLDDGTKVRFCKKCDANIGPIAPARSRYAKKS
ncbi:MAG: 50S ribosomal protein L24 [Thermogutta sp.]